MNIAVIGANGKTGRVFVRMALAAGHSVRAGIHRHDSLAANEKLTVLQCDAGNTEEVTRLLQGCDAVVILIGHVRKSPRTVQANAITATLQAMERHGMRRLISLTGTGVRFPGDIITPIDRVMNVLIALIDPARIRDGKNHVNVIRGSNVDWTVIRVLKLTNRPAGAFALTNNGPAKTFVPREEVAQGILQELSNKHFVHRAPIISPVSPRSR